MPGVVRVTSVVVLACAVSWAHQVAIPGETYGEAVQLLRPQGHGLEVVSEGVELLRKIHTPVHVVSVVGGFHTGKSFLLNKLMNTPPGSGFPIGSTVNPETRGAWLWSKKISVEHTDGAVLKYPILFVDSEGFSAPDNTASYDAKMFAVVTLLSSHLVYNSVRNIDQKEIEYLEMYARRTQMFQVRAELHSASGNVSSTVELPDLTWTVQDFIQENLPGESSQQWLDRLLGAQHLGITDGTEEHLPKRSMSKIFKTTNCKTLFIPSLQGRQQLSHLNDAGVVLTDEYQTDLDDLRNSIVTALIRREHDESTAPIKSGVQLAAFAELLVEATNAGLLSKVPSLWELFLRQQVQEAVDSARAFFDHKIQPSRDLVPPIPQQEFMTSVDGFIVKAGNVYHQLLIGLATPEAESGFQALQRTMAEKRKLVEFENKDRIVTYLDAATKKFLVELESTASTFPLPMATKTLAPRLQALSDAANAASTEIAEPYTDVSYSYLARRAKDISEIVSTFTHKNQQLLGKVLNDGKIAAAQLHEQRLSELLQSHGQGCVCPAELASKHNEVQEVAVAKFKALVAVASEEENFSKHLSDTKTRLVDQLGSVSDKNNECVTRLARRVIEKELSTAEANLATLSVPMSRATLDAAAKREYALREASYAHEMLRFKDNSVVALQRGRFQKEFAESKKSLEAANAAAVERLITRPLRKARERLQDLAPLYYLTISFKARCREVAREKIAASGSLDPKFEEFLGEALEHWLSGDDMQRLVNGVWFYTLFAAVGTAILGAAGGGWLYLNSRQRVTTSWARY